MYVAHPVELLATRYSLCVGVQFRKSNLLFFFPQLINTIVEEMTEWLLDFPFCFHKQVDAYPYPNPKYIRVRNLQSPTGIPTQIQDIDRVQSRLLGVSACHQTRHYRENYCLLQRQQSPSLPIRFGCPHGLLSHTDP